MKCPECKEEYYNGGVFERLCPDCDKKCPECNGDGIKSEIKFNINNEPYQGVETCKECGGSGEKYQ